MKYTNFFMGITFLLMFTSCALASTPTQKMINDAFFCKASPQEASKVSEYLSKKQRNMTRLEAKKLDFPMLYAYSDQKISVNGYVGNIVQVSGKQGDDLISLSLILPEKNSLQVIESLAKKYRGKGDDAYNEQAIRLGLNVRYYTLLEGTQNNYRKTFSLSNAWDSDYYGIPSTMIEFSCQYIKLS